MAINFPSGPSTNQVYTESGKTWRYDGTAWRTQNVTAIVSGGTGLTSITAGNALLSSNSGASGLVYRTLIAGSGISFSFGSNDLTITSTPAGSITGSGTSAFIPLFDAGGTELTDSVMQQFGTTIIVGGSIKAQTKSFKISHPLYPEKMYLEHGSLEGPEHGIYQRGRASGYGNVVVKLPDYFQALSENEITVHITSRVDDSLYVAKSNSSEFKVQRVRRNLLRKQYIEFDYFVVGERTDIKLIVEQPK
jgi:hypothetical protein